MTLEPGHAAGAIGQQLAGKSVCIVTPGAIGSNPRVVKEADALHAAGAQVKVIATRTLQHVDARDSSLIQRIKWDLERVDLRAKATWRRRRITQLTARTAFGLTNAETFVDMASSPFTAALRPAALATAADLYIAHYPAALPVAAAAARRHGARYAYDAEDFHLGDWPAIPAFDLDRSLVQSIERRYLPGCHYVTAASPGIADAYAETYRIARPHVLLNVFPLRQAPATSTPRRIVEPGPSIYWFSQTVGADRGIECAVRAIGMAKSQPHLYLRGTVAVGYGEHLQTLARDAGVVDRVHLLAPASPDDMERLAACYDLGLCGEPGHTANNLRALSNKLFSFLLAGLPPLMSATPAHVEFAAESGLQDLVYPIGDAMALAALIDRSLSDGDLLATARAKAARLARERYNWDRESTRLVEAVAKL